jgi:catechol 2,3-dioxygenase-like lactoylglutathione lyase family enzyme
MHKAYSFFCWKTAGTLRSSIIKIPILLLLSIFSSCTTSEPIDGYPLLGAGNGINNATLIVNDLKSTRDYYADTLGFDLPDTDEFNKGVIDGTITTSIGFPDMSSLELLALEDSLVSPSTPSFITSFLEKYEGIGMYSLSSSSADTTYTWLTSQGFKMDSVQSYRTTAESPKGWSWDDGKPEERSVAFTNKNSISYLPQFVEDTDTDYQEMIKQRKTYYGYYRSYSNHPNGVVGIAALQIAVDSLDVVRDQFKKMGLRQLESNTRENTIRFQLKRQQELQLTSPQSTDDAISKFLQERGSGVFASNSKGKKFIKELQTSV